MAPKPGHEYMQQVRAAALPIVLVRCNVVVVMVNSVTRLDHHARSWVHGLRMVLLSAKSASRSLQPISMLSSRRL